MQISDTMRAALGALIEVEEREGLKLKGVDQPVRAYVVKSIQDSPATPEAEGEEKS